MRFALFVLLLLTTAAPARDDGRYANSPLKQWFDSLKSGRGFCCSEADGRETEYDIRDSHYWVPVNGVWTEVPEDAVIKAPNKVGRPMCGSIRFKTYVVSFPDRDCKAVRFRQIGDPPASLGKQFPARTVAEK